jgi:hypothetical protein
MVNVIRESARDSGERVPRVTRTVRARRSLVKLKKNLATSLVAVGEAGEGLQGREETANVTQIALTSICCKTRAMRRSMR